MELYLQSRGFEQDYDYNWVNEDQKIVSTPYIFYESSHLLQVNKRALLLTKSQNKLMLSVTDIESTGRKDYQNRRIRVSVIWEAEYSQDNLEYFRYLAIRILKGFIGQDNFLKEISDAVESGGENGFIVKSFDVLKPSKPKNKSKLTNQILPGGLLKIEDGNFQELIQNLIQDLESFELPEKDGPLVVVTGIQNKSTLEKAKVWRALSKQIESNDEGNLKEDTKFFRKQPKSNQRANSMATTVTEEKKFSLNILTMVLSLCLIISIVGNIWQWNHFKDIKNLEDNIEKRQGDLNKINDNIGQMQEDLKKINDDIKKSQNDLQFYQKQTQSLEKYFQDLQNSVGQVFEAVDARKASESKSHS